MIFLGVFLRKEGCCPEEIVSSDEVDAHRRTVSRRVRQLRGANAGRRTIRGGWPNSGEAVAVGGDDLLGVFPPAENRLSGGKPLRNNPIKRIAELFLIKL